MPPLVCPHCQNANPETASFCYYDGEALRGGQRAAPRRAAPAEARGAGPRLNLTPRRVHLDKVLAGETRQVEIVVSNQGQGVLSGTLTVADGGEWLRLGGGGNGQCELKTQREQKVSLQIDTRGLPASQTYGAKLTIVTNGGVVEVPVRLDLAAHPFPKAPFQGARTQRELAEKMRTQPKSAVPMLESGEVARWFAANGWNYPIRGTPAKGVAGVQQFFESMGLSKPPVVKLSQFDVRLRCDSLDPVRSQVTLQTDAKKWVYANVESDAPWLRVLTPAVAGAQQTPIAFEVDPRQMPAGRPVEGTITVNANGGQNLAVRVRAQAPSRQGGLVGRLLQPVLAGAIACLLLRLALVPVVDVFAMGFATAQAFGKSSVPDLKLPAPGKDFKLDLKMPGAGEGQLVELKMRYEVGGWLALPWPHLLVAPSAAEAELRDRFAKWFVGIVAVFTCWVGALGGVWLVLRRGSGADLPWGLVAGTFAGVAGGATLGCLVLAGDLLPHLVWGWLSPSASGAVGLLIWIPLALACWSLLGALLGAAALGLGPLGKTVLAPVLGALSGLCRLVGLRGLALYFRPA
jgi:hypothetical protein